MKDSSKIRNQKKTKKYGGFPLLPNKFRITEQSNLCSEITEVSVLFTDGWQHCSGTTNYKRSSNLVLVEERLYHSLHSDQNV